MPIMVSSLLILKIISEGSPAQRKIFLNEADFFKRIDEKMQHHKRVVREMVMEIITNLSAGPDSHLQKLLTKDRVKKILQRFTNDSGEATKCIPKIFSNISIMGSK